MDKSFRFAGVMGWPVTHSRSPAIHNFWVREHGLQAAYGLFPVRPEALADAVRGLRALGIAGCNVTIPHKVAIMPLLDRIDPLARRMGAVNTVVADSDGTLTGYNFDGYGYIQCLRDAKPDWSAAAGPVTVLGAGGAARAVVLSLLDEGAPRIRLINRTREKAEALAAEFGAKVEVHDWSERHEALADVALLVNTTNQGMHGHPPLDLRLDRLPLGALVSDVIYIPLETPLLAAARARGNATVNGLGMLLNQARRGFELWFGVQPRISDALRAALAATF